MAERVALSVLKSNEAKGSSLERILGMNEFASSKELIKEINKDEWISLN